MTRWTVIDPDADGYPWDFPVLNPANFPTPGMFVDLHQWPLGPIPTFDVFVRSVLATALMLCGLDSSYAESSSSKARHLRQDLRSLQLESQWNDEVYGCTNENYCGGNHPGKLDASGEHIVDHMMGTHGRGLNFLARHADNMQRMERGYAPQRTTNLDGDCLPGTVCRWRPLLWVVAIDLNALRGGVVRALHWNDGVPTTEPPAVVRALGIHHPLALPGMPGYQELIA